ncbi:MAG TPA: hypothetical protein VHG72_12620 [Polyangia bacterium]|nr:hypothetical protein [Polyangia bacterium]
MNLALGLILALVRAQLLPAADPHPLPLPVAPEPREPSGDAPSRRPRHARPIDPATMRALFAADPPVAALREAATAQVLAEPDRARSLIVRARLAGWLPEVRLMVDRRFARTESVDLGTSSDPTALAPVGIDSNNDVRYEARATWDLSKLIFNPDEVSAQFQALRSADTRREIESLVIRLYFERRRLKVEAAAADDTDMPSSARRELRIAEVEAELDALTGGAFSRLARPRPFEGESRLEP